MATTIVSNLVVFSDATGHGNQSHLVYAVNQQRWWLFVIKTKTATVVSTYVSSSNDLATATWSTSTDSPAFPSSRALSTNDQRNLGVVSLTNSTTDVAHVSVGIGATGNVTGYIEHIRVTFTGASSITWESWAETASTNTSLWETVKGNTLAISSPSKFVHESGVTEDSNQDANARKSTNADTTSTWTNGFATAAVIDSTMVNICNAYALAPLASDVMLSVYDNGGAASPDLTNLRYVKSGATGTWSAGTGTGNVFTTTSTQDSNDWCMCGVDTTHVFVVRRTGSNAFEMRMYSGTAWSSMTAPPTQNHKATSGLFMATNGTDFWLFLLDSASNQPIKYCKYTVSGDSWGAWTQLEPAGSVARNYISGYPVVANNQIGVIYTEVNGSNFDIEVTSLSISNPTTANPAAILGHF